MSCKTSRRDFLAAAGATTAAVAIAPGVLLYDMAEARPAGAPASAAKRWGLLIDATKCTKECTACVVACKTENGIGAAGRPATDPEWIRKAELRDPASGREISLPLLCQHCAEPPCVDVCPTGASFKRADGVVLVDKHTCIGCRYCMMACPYQARSFVHESLRDQKPHAPRGKGTVESCTLCVHRVDADRTPACVEACRAEGEGAMTFGDLNDPEAEISKRIAGHSGRQIRADLGLDPGVRYLGI
ncbi:MAG: 4Fe-4S dicluster domain-containing protein [Alphaproteobacteria bacterium]|jgi:molybdopterin-containing oxidoreductase family iron-sulfur binding subunit|nr:4Fe-4S dicluster domain-containing protein [Alphaproteobacteria bacterium]